MKPTLAFALLVACGGPSHDQLIDTQAAHSRRGPYEAPPASTSDKDRERSTQQFEDMETTQRAHKEAGKTAPTTPNASPRSPPAQPGTVTKKKGVAEQAPPEPAPAGKKKGVAEQAPPEPAPAAKKKGVAEPTPRR